MKEKNRKVFFACLLAVLLGLLFLYKLHLKKAATAEDGPEVWDATMQAASSDETSGEESPSETEKTLVVYVSGAVKHPGVYELPEGARVYEALSEAGGYSEGASEGRINLAEPLSDGEMIRFPFRDEEIPDGELLSDGRVDINRADKEELMRLPGIGETKAEAIIAYRREHGDFESPEALLEVPGIGEGLLERIRDLIK